MIDIDTGDEGDIEEEEDSGQDEGEVDSDSDFMWDQEMIPLSSTDSSPITSSIVENYYSSDSVEQFVM